MSDYISFSQHYMNECAKWQYNDSGACAINENNHAYGWEALLSDGSKRGLNLQAFTDAKFGGSHKNWRVILTNMGKDGWWFHNPFNQDWVIQPVLFVDSKFAWDTAAVNKATSCYENNLKYVQAWLKEQMGKTFSIASRTQLVIVNEGEDFLLNLARSTSQDGKRFDMLYWCRDKLNSEYKRTNPNMIYSMALFTGDHPAEDYGAGAVSNYSAVSSMNTSVRINPDAMTQIMSQVAYGVGHELFHCFGLPHPDESHGENWQSSIMYWGKPPNAHLTHIEKSRIKNNQYLKEA